MERQNPERARKVVRLVVERMLTGQKIVFTELFKEVGYSEKSIKQLYNFRHMKAYKDEVTIMVHKLELERNRAVRQLRKKIDSGSYGDMVNAIEKFTKTMLLIQGKPTENVGFSIQDLFKRVQENNNAEIPSEVEYRAPEERQIENDQ